MPGTFQACLAANPSAGSRALCHHPPSRRDIEAGRVGFEELEAAALAGPDPWDAGLPSGRQELLDIHLARHVR